MMLTQADMKEKAKRRYGAMQEVDGAIKKQLAEAPEDAMLTEEVGPEEVAQVNE